MKTAICLHLYYQDLWPWFKARLDQILDENTHLYVTVVDLDTPYIKSIKETSNEVFLVENRGTDVAPFLFTYDKIKHLDYKFYTKIHSKKSLNHGKGAENLGNQWRTHLVDCIIGSKVMYDNIINQLKTFTTPILCSNSRYIIKERIDDGNYIATLPYINKVFNLLNIDLEEVTSLNDTTMPPFVAGTMFTVNDMYMSNLASRIDNFPNLIKEFEPGQQPDSLAHGFERAFGYYNTYIKGQFIGINL